MLSADSAGMFPRPRTRDLSRHGWLPASPWEGITGFQGESTTPTCFGMQVVELMAQHFARWAGSPSMPEMAHLATVQLRKLLKQLPAERFRTAIRTLVTALESSCSAVLAARSSRALQLSDAAALQAFPAAVKAEEVSCACTCKQQRRRSPEDPASVLVTFPGLQPCAGRFGDIRPFCKPFMQETMLPLMIR